jgi:stearoyl-CoA desaturase (delta-9 desaturase)
MTSPDIEPPQPIVANPKPSTATGIALALIHLGAVAAAIPALFSWSGLAVAAVLYYLTGGIGICLGYHRLLTHRSMRLVRPLEYAVATLGVLAMQGGPIGWVATHRAHHAFSDTERDPHDSRRGFWWSHVAWLYRRNPARLSHADERRYAADLAADPYYRFLDRSAPWWQLGLAIVLFLAGGWSWVVWGVFARLVVTYHATWLVNSAAHLWGYRTFRAPGRDRSTNNWWVALLAWGEGWHNNHHAFPFSARHGLRWFELDVTWWTIAALALVRLAREVKVPTPAALQRRMLPTALPQRPRSA